jgi:hypothetical protein
MPDIYDIPSVLPNSYSSTAEPGTCQPMINRHEHIADEMIRFTKSISAKNANAN